MFSRNRRNITQNQNRIVVANNQAENAKQNYLGNYIRTSKYTLLTFLPLNLFNQMKKMANVYFVIIAVMQAIPSISISGGKPVILLPLLFVLSVSALKDALEDLQRHRSDAEENNRRANVIRNGRLTQVPWQEVEVGDIIKVTSDQYFPADAILLSSSTPKGLCYVETANLDGETNLKHKIAAKETVPLIIDDDSAARFHATLDCEGPNEHLYIFKGVLRLGHGAVVSLDANQMLLRGSSLRNTSWIYGLVMYTGHESKVMKNSTRSRSKQSSVERMTNRQIIYIFCMQMVLCIIGGIANGVWYSEHQYGAWYLRLEHPSIAAAIFERIFTWMLIFTNFVPISLIVSLETVKYCQAYFISWDLNIYDANTDTPTAVQSSNLNEELGQIQYIFSDKTGTLTCNLMEFRKCSIGGISYGTGTTEIGRAAAALRAGKGKSASPASHYDDSTVVSHGPKPAAVPNVNFDDPSMFSHMKGNHPNTERIRAFFTHLAVCHTIIPEKAATGEIKYQASSPDELALTRGAQFAGFFFHSRSEDGITITALGKEETYEVLNVIEFNSTRKRMSVIVRCPNGKIKLLTKGADTVIFPRLLPGQALEPVTIEHMEQYAEEGLRTLVIAEAELDPAAYTAWNRTWDEARNSIEGREDKLDAAAELIEKNLILLGSTAIEDRLQDQVPQTIAALMEAGIKVWMLTGDKIETAINIAFACNLIDQQMERYQIDARELQDVHEQLKKSKEHMDALLNEYETRMNASGAKNKKKKKKKGKEQEEDHASEIQAPTFALVISGEALISALKPDLAPLLLAIATKCKAVVACRVSPKQKAEVVRLVRDNLKTVTLSIGDGANDVNMIMAAHVGVGISGQEGLQAARAADYAIAQFSFLRRLLLVHGREAYRRNSKLVCYTFYKNICFVMPMFFFGWQSAFSGQPFYNAWVYQFYNIFYTALPICIYAIFDIELPHQVLWEKPQLYKPGLNGELFNTKVFWQWVLTGNWHALSITIICSYIFDYPIRIDGQTDGIWVLGAMVYAGVVVVVNLKLAIEMTSWNWFTFFILAGSILSYFLSMGFISEVVRQPVDLIGVVERLTHSPAFYFSLPLMIVLALTIDFMWKVVIRWIFPQLAHVMQEQEYMANHNSVEFFASRRGYHMFVEDDNLGGADKLHSDSEGESPDSGSNKQQTRDTRLSLDEGTHHVNDLTSSSSSSGAGASAGADLGGAAGVYGDIVNEPPVDYLRRSLSRRDSLQRAPSHGLRYSGFAFSTEGSGEGAKHHSQPLDSEFYVSKKH